jgi:DNA-binding NarL/FixJ family response regulator
MKPTVRAAARRHRILIVNGLTVWREAITSRINRSSGLKVCGAAIGERAAFEKVNRLHPSLVLTEIFRAEDLGFVKELHRRHPRLPIVVFSFREEEAYAPLALEAGARGYLPKGVPGDTLVAGIRKALRGGVALSPNMGVRLRRIIRPQGARRAAGARRYAEAPQRSAEYHSAAD